MGNLKGVGKTRNLTTDEYFGDTANRKWYETVMFTSQDMPELDDMEPGKEYRLVVMAKLKTKSESDEGKCDGKFEIVAVKADAEVQEMDPTQKHFAKMLG